MSPLAATQPSFWRGGLMRAAIPVSYAEDDAYLPDEDDEFDNDASEDESANV